MHSLFAEWTKRPMEIKTLFNPMFCAVILNNALINYQQEEGKHMPIPLVFLVLPLVLHSKTRIILPKLKNANMGLWCRDNENSLIPLAERVKSLNQITLLALSFLQINGYVEFLDSTIKINKEISGTRAYLRLNAELGTEISEIYSKSQLIGRWFAKSGDAAMIYTYLGVRP